MLKSQQVQFFQNMFPLQLFQFYWQSFRTRPKTQPERVRHHHNFMEMVIMTLNIHITCVMITIFISERFSGGFRIRPLITLDKRQNALALQTAAAPQIVAAPQFSQQQTTPQLSQQQSANQNSATSQGR